MNNGITTVKMGMPFKPNTMTQGNMFSLHVLRTHNIYRAKIVVKNGMVHLHHEALVHIYRQNETAQLVIHLLCKDYRMEHSIVLRAQIRRRNTALQKHVQV